jgi:hypothetical protein
MTEAQPLDHVQLVASLDTFLTGDYTDRFVFTEVALGSRTMSSHLGIVDALVMNKSFSNPDFRVYEVKASTSDLLADLRESKFEKYLPYADHMWFALGPDVDNKKLRDYPVGILQLTDGKWKRLRVAPPNNKRRPWPEWAFISLLLYHTPKVIDINNNLRHLQDLKESLLKEDIRRLEYQLDGKLQERLRGVLNREKRCESLEQDTINAAYKTILERLGQKPDYFYANPKKPIDDLLHRALIDPLREEFFKRLDALEKELGIKTEDGA